MNIIELMFENFWTFLGSWLIIISLLNGIANIIKSIRMPYKEIVKEKKDKFFLSKPDRMYNEKNN